MPHARVNGISIYYEEHGAGTPLLLVMGFTANTTAWEPVLPALSSRYRVIAFDNRGAGRSDAPEAAYSMTELADDALGLLTHLGVERAHVYGVSMGGMIAQHIALRAPHRVLSVVLGCTSPGGKHAVTAAEPVIAALLGAATLPIEQAFDKTLPILYSDGFAAAHRDELYARALQNAPLRASEAGVKGQAAAIQGHDTFDRLPEIAAPTLVLHGDADQLVPTANGRLLAEHIPGAKLTVYPGARHGFHVEFAEQSSADVLAFLDAVAAAAPA
ncbi:MAG TPA: alpha/beta fold hydrolase [Dehalococcoidia bacterium]|nr:alpha/beta fold hydrolase [Dehalococcoidia bacterium]